MPSEQQIESLFNEAKELFKRKLADYGTKDIAEMGEDDEKRMLTILATRLNEKRRRAMNILEHPQSRVQVEPLRDSFLDGMGYNAILAFLCDGIWEENEGTSVAQEHTDGCSCKPEPLENERTTVLVKQHMPDGGIVPPQHPGDAGYDLVCAEGVEVQPFGQVTSIPIGISVKLPEGWWAEIKPRSSAAKKWGIFVHPSTMDCGYTGNWYVFCNALGKDKIKVEKGTRLAQCILHKINTPGIEVVRELPETQRGSNGFGSTGK